MPPLIPPRARCNPFKHGRRWLNLDWVPERFTPTPCGRPFSYARLLRRELSGELSTTRHLLCLGTSCKNSIHFEFDVGCDSDARYLLHKPTGKRLRCRARHVHQEHRGAFLVMETRRRHGEAANGTERRDDDGHNEDSHHEINTSQASNIPCTASTKVGRVRFTQRTRPPLVVCFRSPLAFLRAQKGVRTCSCAARRMVFAMLCNTTLLNRDTGV